MDALKAAYAEYKNIPKERMISNQKNKEKITALRAVEVIHFDAGGSQGYFDEGYSWRDHCCNECGSLGEYGIEWPCPTITSIESVLNG